MNFNRSFRTTIDDDRERNAEQMYHWSALFLIVFSLMGIVGNLLVCLAIGTERRLHNRTNWFLFSLALADMIVSGVVIPLAIVKEFTGKYFRIILFSSKTLSFRVLDLRSNFM